MVKRDLILLHLRLCDELNIPPAKIAFDTELSEEVAGFYNTAIKQVEINLSADCCLWMVMAHETYHHYQRIKGWLDEESRYKGKIYSGPYYYADPCERAADRYMIKIAKREGWYETKSKQKA